MGLFGPPSIAKLKAKRDVPGLIKALDYRSDRSLTAPMSAEAADALGEIGDLRAVEPLLRALHDPGGEVREAAARSLGRIGDLRSIEPLADMLLDAEAGVRRVAADGLTRMGRLPTQGRQAAAYWAARGDWERFVATPGRTEEGLVLALGDPHDALRSAAAQTVGSLGPVGLELLLPLVDDPVANRFGAVAEGLGFVGRAAVEPLLSVLARPSGSARFVAADALGRIGDARAVAPLVELARSDSDKGLREVAAQALGRIGAPAVEPLIQALREAHPTFRPIAVEILGSIGGPACAGLVEALGDADGGVRRAAADGLDKAGWVADETSAGAAYRIVRGDVDACIPLGAAAVEPLIAALGFEWDWGIDKVRRDAAGALGQIGDVRAVEPLVAFLESDLLDHAGSSWVAIDALERIGTLRAKAAADAAKALLEAMGEERATEPEAV